MVEQTTIIGKMFCINLNVWLAWILCIRFYNDRPEVNQLAQDRWKIFKIQDDDLVDVTHTIIFKKK